jgi:hypothetical protein
MLGVLEIDPGAVVHVRHADTNFLDRQLDRIEWLAR